MSERRSTRRANRARPAKREKRAPGVLPFILRFVGFWVGSLLLAESTPVLDDWAVGHTVASLQAALQLLTGSGYSAGSSVGTGHLHFSIVPDCTPVMPILLFSSACLAFPATWRWKILGIMSATLILWLYNLVRVLVLFLVMSRWPAAFDFVHVYLWQTTTLIVVFLLFVCWLRMQRAAGGHAPAPNTVAVPSSAVAGR
jgi:exosortase/archaeosortase family protein